MFKSGIDNCRNKEALIYKCVTILIRLYLNSHIPCEFVKIQIIDDADLDNDGQNLIMLWAKHRNLQSMFNIAYNTIQVTYMQDINVPK